MFFWCDGKDAGLCKKSLDNSTNLCFVGTLAFSENFVNPAAVKEEIDKELVKVNENLIGNVGVRLGRVQKSKMPFECVSKCESFCDNPMSVIQIEADSRDLWTIPQIFALWVHCHSLEIFQIQRWLKRRQTKSWRK